jgi:hypothetical protein
VNREFELVRLLERDTEPPTRDEIAIQFATLVAAIDHEISPRRAPARRVHRALLRSLVATTVVLGLGGGAAFAWSQLAPDAQDVATVARHYRSSAGVHRPGWRPELDAERVVCDYRGLGLATTSTYSYASEFPLTQPLTQERLVDECRSRTDATTGTGSITQPAALCAVTPPGERLAVPVVTFGTAECTAPLTIAPASLLVERNRLRRAETAIRAVPETCPTPVEARRWVDEQVSESGETLRVLPVETHPGGRCYLPFVHWGRGQVEIIATVNPASSTNGTGTVLPQAS